MSGPLLFTLYLEPPPVTFDLYGPSDDLLQRAYDDDEGRLIGIVGPTGASGPEAPPYEHEQTTPSVEWVVNHNRGWHPIVQVLSPGGSEVVAEVLNISTNQVRIYFAQPSTGKAVVR